MILHSLAIVGTILCLQSASPPAARMPVVASYPRLAWLAGIQGEVRVEIKADPRGKASVNRVLSGHKLLADGAVENVRRWEFETNGQETVFPLAVRFEIISAEACRADPCETVLAIRDTGTFVVRTKAAPPLHDK